MKQFTNTKWMLSALLITALGSQYYYSISSQELLSIDMSSRAVATTDVVEQTVVDATAIITAAVSGTETVSGTATTSTDGQPVPPPPAQPTEGGDAAACSDCVILTRQEAELVRRALTRVAATPAPVTPVVAATPTVDPNETPAERMRREREERALAREEAAELRREEELEALETRNEDFNTKMEEAAERCRRTGVDELDCMSRRYTSLLRRYRGRNNIDPRVAQAAYRNYVEPALRAKLSSMDDTSDGANEALAELMNNLPSEYRLVKESATLTVRRATEARATSITATLAEAKAASDNRDFAESQSLLMQAQQENEELRRDIYGSPTEGREGILDVLSAARTSDSATWAYMQSNLITPVRNLFTNINTEYNRLFSVSSTTGTNTQNQTQGNDRTSVRGSDARGPQLPNGTADVKLGVPQVNTSNNGVSFSPIAPNQTGSRLPRN